MSPSGLFFAINVDGIVNGEYSYLIDNELRELRDELQRERYNARKW
ncbi:MAG: hypothetical protein [Bacteriophage sp.]|nr:MAG: hypothetical protein [Bacteriophage sp.]